ncbi:CbtB domain-containing protein [Methylopila sp. 73B]|uniref:CbtB domain-containing protein n=1 Tax=Methylopila sp. 73B TaxID=1120792 RepID=UPI00037ABE44|nr:CbtB domain-containing protein [Methylopila sp. 73B]
MAAKTLTSVDRPIPIPVDKLLPWMVFVGVLAVLVVYFVGGAQDVSVFGAGGYAHEFLHDARHLLGFPCH